MKKLFIILLFFPLLASATNYYISSTGSDAAAGTSTGTAWQTIAKVNSSTFNPGDSILFRRGDMWREQLTPPSSGSAGNPITFSAYGTGAKPIINAANIISAWTNTSTNVWSASLTPTYAMIIIGGIIFKEEADLASVNAASEYFISGGSVYVYSTVNPNTLGAEISVRQFGVYVTGHHINIKNIECRFAWGGGIMFDGVGIDGQCVVDSCYAYANRLWGVVSRGGHNNDVFKNSSADYNGNGFYAWDGSDGITMQACSTAHSIHYKDISQFSDGGAFQNYRGDNFLVEYCYSIDDYDSFHPDAGGRSIHATFRYNKAFNSRFGSGDPNTPTAGFGSLGAGGVIEFYYNLFVNGASSGIECYSTNNGTVRIWNNTFYEDATHATDAIMYLANGLNIDVKNNIIVREFVLGEYTLANFNTPAITSDNNCWYMYNFTPGNGPIRHYYQSANYYTLTTWNTATGRDASSISVDPLFVNVASDWSLQATSPCINAGVSVGLTVDILGNSIVGNPDIGAFEYTAGGNQSPTANAGSDVSITLPTSSTTLSGSGNDPDGTITTYAWAKFSGPATYTIASPSSASTGLSNLVEGTYVFRLTVTDNGSATDTDDVTVTVNPASSTGTNIFKYRGKKLRFITR